MLNPDSRNGVTLTAHVGQRGVLLAFELDDANPARRADLAWSHFPHGQDRQSLGGLHSKEVAVIVFDDHDKFRSSQQPAKAKQKPMALTADTTGTKEFFAASRPRRLVRRTLVQGS